jgi:ankyrin repeat protein
MKLAHGQDQSYAQIGKTFGISRMSVYRRLKGNIEAVKHHIAAGTDLNAKDNFGKATLHLAAVGGHKEVAELLIAAGADMNAKADDSLTPLDWAISQKHPEIADLLCKHGGISEPTRP